MCFGKKKKTEEKPVEKKGREPAWMKVARSLKGLREIKGKLHNPKILEMWKQIDSEWFVDDETPWCAGYVGYCLEIGGVESTNNARAKSYMSWSHGVTIPGPVYGCVVVFHRGKRLKNPKAGSGHVGFVVGKDQKGRLMVLGGNQGDAVNIKPFHKNRVAGYYYPKGHHMPDPKDLPLVDGAGMRVSKNEA